MLYLSFLSYPILYIAYLHSHIYAYYCVVRFHISMLITYETLYIPGILIQNCYWKRPVCTTRKCFVAWHKSSPGISFYPENQQSPSQYCSLRGTIHKMENKRNIIRYRLKGLHLLLRREPTICPHLCKVHSHAYPVSVVRFGRFKHLRPGFLLFLPEANFLISERIKCCCFFYHLSMLAILDLKPSLLLIYYMPLLF